MKARAAKVPPSSSDETRRRGSHAAALIEQAPVIMYRFARDGTCVQANHAARRVRSSSAADAVGWNVLTDARATVPVTRAAIQRVFAGERVELSELEWRPPASPHGAVPALWLDVHCVPIKDAHGTVREVLLVAIDISERKRSADALQHSQAYLEALVRDVDGIVWEADPLTLRFTFVSPQAERLLGYPLSEWHADGFWLAHLHADDREYAVDFCSAAVNRLENHTFEYRMVAADGRSVWLRDVVTVIAENERAVRLRGIMLDITAQKEADAERQRAREQVEALNRDLEERVRQRTAELEAFGYSVSHDLRAPLRTIEGFSRILREEHAGELSPAASRHLDRVRSAATRMGTLIDHLLELSRVARIEVRRRKVDVSRLARAVIAELRQADAARHVDVSVHDNLVAHADATLLRVVLENLLGNAWKYTSRTSAPRIEIGRCGDEPATFYVRDNGAGFDMADADKLFVPFQRLHRAEDFEGTGVGLATVQRIVRQHSGEIWADAAPQRGASFYFTLERSPRAGDPRTPATVG